MKISLDTFKLYLLNLAHAIIYFALLYFSFQYSEVAYGREVNISIFLIAILIGCFYLLSAIHNIYSRIIGYFWLWWMLLGIANAAVWSILFANLDLKLETACLIYTSLLMCFLLGIFVFDKKTITPPLDLTVKPNSIWSIIILVFPLIMMIESYLVLGYIPILSGGSIIDSMYSANYGKLYSYKSVMVFSIILSVYYSTYFDGKDKFIAVFFSILTLVFLMISLFDGKRVIFLCSALSIFIYLHKLYGLDYIKKRSIFFISCIFLCYTGIANLRSGDISTSMKSVEILLYSTGAEFRDFIWTVTYYEPGTIPGYSWVSSSLGAFINGNILSIFGFDKNALVAMDSARSWMNLFDIDLGIRTGMFSELWFEFGVYAILPVFILGLFTSKICGDICRATTIETLIFKLFVFGCVFLAVMGQSTLFFGMLITCIYIFILYSFIDFLTPKKRG